jgi:hypothetical protein
MVLTFFANATELKRTGWNLISVCQDLNRTDINMTGINEIQAQDGKSIYTGTDAQFSNLTQLEAGYGYWVYGSTGVTFSSGERVLELKKPLLREGWNLMASCESIAKVDVDIRGISEIQSQAGQTIYTGALAQYSNLENLSKGYGYWVKGRVGREFTSKRALKIPEGFDFQAITNSGISVEYIHEGYEIRVYTDSHQNSNDQANHTGIVITLDNTITLPTLNIQDSYRGENIVIVVYRSTGELIAVSDIMEVSMDSPITTIAMNVANLNDNGNSTDTSNNDLKDFDSEFQGVRVFAEPLRYSEYALRSMSDSEFNSLSSENQYLLAAKLLSVLFYGMPRTELETLINSGTFISSIQTKLGIDNSDLKSTEDYIKDKDYNWSESNANREKILARLFHLDLGKHYLHRWAAYVLTQNIMFSPANELETVGASDILNVYNRLVFLMDDDYSMQMITYLHMTSDDNWKRFRSPEDNGREMLEIFLLDFNDSHVPKAGIALQNWRLNKNDNELVIGLSQNDVPQNLFQTTVTTGFDFYRELVKTFDFRKGVITRLVNRYFPKVTDEKRFEIISTIVNSNPNSFQDILLQIIFSKEFLLNTAKVKTIEETTFYIAKSIYFFDRLNFFAYMRDNMDNMHQSPLSYKLGRNDVVPIDTLSFAYYHDFLRRYVLNDVKTNSFNDWDGGWNTDFIDKSIPNTSTIDGLINHIFLSVIARESTTEERLLLANYAANEARGTYDDMRTYNDRQGVTQIVMEYLSRLTETYTFKKIEE